jgi:hypothetical protein
VKGLSPDGYANLHSLNGPESALLPRETELCKSEPMRLFAANSMPISASIQLTFDMELWVKEPNYRVIVSCDNHSKTPDQQLHDEHKKGFDLNKNALEHIICAEQKSTQRHKLHCEAFFFASSRQVPVAITHTMNSVSLQGGRDVCDLCRSFQRTLHLYDSLPCGTASAYATKLRMNDIFIFDSTLTCFCSIYRVRLALHGIIQSSRHRAVESSQHYSYTSITIVFACPIHHPLTHAFIQTYPDLAQTPNTQMLHISQPLPLPPPPKSPPIPIPPIPRLSAIPMPNSAHHPNRSHL